MNSFYTIALLIASNVFMTLAWYGHLKMAEFSWFKTLPLIGVIALSWGIAFFEYCLQVPANRIGFEGNGGPFSLMQLKILQEVITLVVFIVFSVVAFHMQVKWNHIVAGVCLIAAVYFVFGFKQVFFESKIRFATKIIKNNRLYFVWIERATRRWQPKTK